MDKRVIVAIAVVLVAIIGVAVTVYIIKNDKSQIDNPGAYYGQSADGFSANVDKNKQLGAGKVLTSEQVSAGFGEGTTVAKPSLSGTVNLGTTKSETATYNVKTPKGDVTFETDVRTYASSADLRRANPFAGAEQEKIDVQGQEAHYLVPFGQELLPDQQVALLTTKDKTSYKFALIQQKDKVYYSLDDAKRIVLELAKQAKLNEVK